MPKNYAGIEYLGAAPDETLLVDENGARRASLIPQDNPAAMDASLAGPAPKYTIHQEVGMGGTKSPKYKVKEKKLTDEEMRRMADQMLANQQAMTEARMAEGPAVTVQHDPMDPDQTPAWLHEYMASQR